MDVLDGRLSLTLAFLEHVAQQLEGELIKLLIKPRVCVCVRCLLYTSPSPRDMYKSRMPSSA